MHEDHDDGVATWLLTKPQRANAQTVLDDIHPGDQAWSTGNLVRPLVHGATYFAELHERLQATRPGDIVYFTDWQGDADEQLLGREGTEVAEVLARADERGVDVRGLVWRSHGEAIGFAASQNRRLGRTLQRRGAEALLDMRVRLFGSHHQKMVVIRHGEDPTRDIAFIGGIDLCHSRRDDLRHGGDPQAEDNLSEEYGETPPWHDIQAAISGPAVYDAETVFRERWLDPTPLSRSPLRTLRDKVLRMDLSPDPLPDQAPPPPPVPGGTHAVQLLRTYPNLRQKRDYDFAVGGERSVARGYTKALARARGLVYIEDQYLWGQDVGDVFVRALERTDDLRIIAVVPLHPDVTGISRAAQLFGRRRAMSDMTTAADGRVAFYGIENPAGVPIYVHAKTCVVDDTWMTIGSDNFNRRSWTHDSELSAALIDTATDGPGLPRRLRLRLAAEHLGRLDDAPDPADDDHVLAVTGDLVSPQGWFDAFASCAAALDDWHAGGRVGPRPPGRLRRLEPPPMGRLASLALQPIHDLFDDPDGRPKPLRKRKAY